MSISDRDVLLKEIYDNPDDITAKLKWVDWVKEWSETPEEIDRAALIQAMYEIKAQKDGKYEASEENDKIQNTLEEMCNNIVKRNPQWYQITCPKCNGEGMISNPKYNPSFDYQRTHIICPVCEGSMDLIYTISSRYQVHDSVIYDEKASKLDWNMGFIRSIEFEALQRIWNTYGCYTYKPTKRILYILKEIPSISRIKISRIDEPKKIDCMLMDWMGSLSGKTRAKPIGIKQKYTWSDHRNILPSGVMDKLNRTNDNRFDTEKEAYDELWKAICEYVKDWAKMWPNWETIKD